MISTSSLLKVLYLFLALFFVILFTENVSASLNVSLSNQGTEVRIKSTGGLLTSGDIEITVWDSLTGGNLVYNETFADAIVNGSWNVMLGENSSNPLPLEFGNVYYYDYRVNGGDMNFTNLTGDSVGRQFFYSPLGDISDEDISDDTNLTLGEKITFTLGGIIDNIVNGWIAITGGLNVTGNVSVGGNLDVTGNVTAGYFVGDGSELTRVGGHFVGRSTSSYNGSLSAGGYTGYGAGNYLCDSDITGSHLCSFAEIDYTIGTRNLSAISGWTGEAWISTGPAKYSPAGLPVNDCNGFTHGSLGSYLGNWWNFNTATGGVGKTGNCANTLRLACCI